MGTDSDCALDLKKRLDNYLYWATEADEERGARYLMEHNQLVREATGVDPHTGIKPSGAPLNGVKTKQPGK